MIVFENALAALNYLEDGGRVLVSLPGNYVSTAFELTEKGVYSGNNAIGFFLRTWAEMSKSALLRHFAEMLKEGGEIAAI